MFIKSSSGAQKTTLKLPDEKIDYQGKNDDDFYEFTSTLVFTCATQKQVDLFAAIMAEETCHADD